MSCQVEGGSDVNDWLCFWPCLGLSSLPWDASSTHPTKRTKPAPPHGGEDPQGGGELSPKWERLTGPHSDLRARPIVSSEGHSRPEDARTPLATPAVQVPGCEPREAGENQEPVASSRGFQKKLSRCQRKGRAEQSLHRDHSQ